MTNTITIGKRLIPLEHIALVGPFDPAAHPGMRTDKAFKARVILTRYLGLSGSRFWTRAFDMAIGLFLALAFALHTFSSGV